MNDETGAVGWGGGQGVDGGEGGAGGEVVVRRALRSLAKVRSKAIGSFQLWKSPGM